MPRRSADEKRRLKCTTGQFHQVIALSEQMLNGQLLSYYELVPALQRFDIQNKFMHTGIDVSLYPPRLSVPMSEGSLNRSQLEYCLRIKEGTITYSPEPLYLGGGTPVTQAIKDWDLKFKVNLDMEEVREADRAEVKAFLRVAGEYSIQRLLLNFTSADTTRLTINQTEMKFADGTTIPDVLFQQLSGWITGWLARYNEVEARLRDKELLENDKTGERKDDKLVCPLLYAALAPKPEQVNAIAPTIPPTSLILQTHAYKDLSGHVRSENQKRNALLYTEMCKNDPLPSDQLFNDSGAIFVTNDLPTGISSDGIPYDNNIVGTMCLSSEILFDTFFIPRLNPIVKQTHCYISEATTNFTGGSQGYSWSVRFGQDQHNTPAESPSYLMKRMPGTDDLDSERLWFGQKGDNGLGPGFRNPWGYRWVMSESQKVRSSAEYESANFIGGKTKKKGEFTVETRSLTQLIPIEGENRVRLNGQTTIATYVTHDIEESGILTISSSNLSVNNGFATTGFWSVDFVIEAIQSGAMQIQIKFPEKLVEFTEWGENIGSLSNFDGEAAVKILEDKLKENIESLKTYLETNFADALKQGAFVLAGGGHFFLNNPLFSKRGDLIIELKYDGIPADGTPSTKPQLTTVQMTAEAAPTSVDAHATPVTLDGQNGLAAEKK